MAREMSFDKYIDNPSGGSVYTNRNMYKQMYKEKFSAVLLREQGKIHYELYTINDGKDSHYIYMKIPSEVIPEFYYDVVIQLYTTNNGIKNEANLRRYSVKFYSNDPAFVYTFAHSFAKNNLFITDLELKMSKQALRTKAVMKNPKDNVWYVKSLYFAYLTMEKYNLFSKPMFSNNGKPYKKKELLNKITQAEIKVQQRQDEAERINREKAKELEKQKREKRLDRPVNNKNNTKVSKTSKVSKTAKSSKKTKRSMVIHYTI